MGMCISAVACSGVVIILAVRVVVVTICVLGVFVSVGVVAPGESSMGKE
jgi:hypothetical protein